MLAILIGLNVGPASAAPDLAVVDRYTNPDGSVDWDRLRKDYERQRTPKRPRASLAKPAASPPVRVSPSSLRTEPVRTAAVRPATADNTVTSTTFLLRQNFSDIYLFTDITETAKAKGAEFSWSRDNVARDTVLAANGMVALAFRRLTDEYPLDGSPWLIGVAVAPYVQFQRESHSGAPKQNVDLLTSGGTAEIGFGNVWAGSQYFRGRIAATSDNIKDTTVVHAVAEWLPVYREFGGTVPGTYLLYKFQPELKAQYDSATDGIPLVFSNQRQAFRLGPEATLLFKLHGAEIPDFIRRINGRVTYRWAYETYSQRTLNWLDASLGYNIDQAGHLALVASYQKGNVEATGATNDVYKITLNGKTCADLSAATAC